MMASLRKWSWLAAAVLIAGAALVHGAATHRWTVGIIDAERVERLHALEVRFANWLPQVIPTEMPAHEQVRATSRHYAPPGGHPSAVISVFSGPPGAVTTHTPDVCYAASGYRCTAGPRRHTLSLPDGRPIQYYMADFEKRSASLTERVRVRWSWTADGRWEAPERPRWQFARRFQWAPLAVKLYIVTPLAADGTPPPPQEEEAIAGFVAATFAQYAALWPERGEE